jgi:catechol 2,3-dioxygenase-like lactoylglutathione lyase family enzyme
MADELIERLDHLVLTVADIDASIRFYTEVLGMREETFGENRKALRFGESKINLHLCGHELQPAARTPTPGSADLCFVIRRDLDDVLRALTDKNVAIEEGPVARTGSLGPIRSIYIRDPDGNLIELSTYG